MVAKEELCNQTDTNPKRTQVDYIKHDFYETPNNVTLCLYVKQTITAMTRVDFSESRITIVLQTLDAQFAKQHGVSEPNKTLFEWNFELFERVQPHQCTYNITSTKIELRLVKSNTVQWTRVLKHPTAAAVAAAVSPSTAASKTATAAAAADADTSPSGTALLRSTPVMLTEEQTTPLLNAPNRSTIIGLSHQRSAAPLVNNSFYGLTGLTNLGNTCYMNAAIQFLINATDFRDYFLETPHLFQKDINTENALGMNGQIAIAFAMLMRQLWKKSAPSSASASNEACVAPSKLRALICAKYAHYRGFEQQDTHEFLCSLISLLHEDLNRVLKKPYYESALECEEDAGAASRQVALDSWARFVSRENSALLDLFYGQFKSKLTCPECHKISITFEPFNNLLVPIAKARTHVQLLLIYSAQKSLAPTRFTYFVSESETIRELIDMVVADTKNITNKSLRAFVVSKINSVDSESAALAFESDYRFIQDYETLSSLKRNELLILNELEDFGPNEPTVELHVQQVCKYPIHTKTPCANQCSYCHKIHTEESPPLPRCTRCFRSAYCNSECQKNDWSKHSAELCSQSSDLIGVPCLVSLRRSDVCNQAEFASQLNRALSAISAHSVDIEYQQQQSSASSEDGGAAPTMKHEFILQSSKTTIAGSAKSFTSVDLLQQYLAGCLPSAATTTSTAKLTTTPTTTTTTSTFKLRVKWNNTPNWRIRTNLSKIATVSGNTGCGASSNGQAVDLDECLKLFTRPERLTSENPWYCSRCKKHQEATKQMSVWRLPRYLIVTLKRFQATKATTDANQAAALLNSSDDPRLRHLMMNMLQNRVVHSKMNNMVHFPLRGLDMSRYISDAAVDNSKQTACATYDLCAVINHLGNSLSLGHYTTFARTHAAHDSTTDELGWRLFDDQNVYNVQSEAHIVSKDAYVLMYRARTNQTTCGPSAATTTATATAACVSSSTSSSGSSSSENAAVSAAVLPAAAAHLKDADVAKAHLECYPANDSLKNTNSSINNNSNAENDNDTEESDDDENREFYDIDSDESEEMDDSMGNRSYNPPTTDLNEID